MSEANDTAGAADDNSAAPVAVARATDILQALLLIAVVGWVLDVPRRLLGLSFYTEQLLAVCLGFALALSFVNAKFSQRWIGWACAAAAIGICGYIAVRYEPLTYSIALLPWEGIIGSAILILLVLEATRRTAGSVLVVIILAIVAYVFIGPHMPGDFATRPVSPARLLVYLGLDTNGMIGNILSVAVLIVVPFTLMGQVLGRTGGAAYFADLAMSAMGNYRGGAAKIAVFGSALFGTISGAAVSNVVAVGVVTIPLMSRSGFTATRAAAIEAVGSTGGQLMPPVMGAAAFIMAEFLQVSYGTVVIAAVIPAILLLRGAVHSRRSGSGQDAHRRGAGRQRAGLPRRAQIGLAFPDPDRLSDRDLDLAGIFPDPDRARRGLFDRHFDRAQHDLRLSRQTRDAQAEMVRAVLDTGRAALDIILIGAAAGMVVGALNISGISFGLTLQLIALSRREPVHPADPDRAHQHRARHGHADGERLCADRVAAGAVDRQARRLADGGAYVCDVFRHAVDDHAAGGDRGLCRRQYRAGVGMERRLERGDRGLEHVLYSVPVRHRAVDADECELAGDRLEFRAQYSRHLRRHRRHCRLCLRAA